MAVQPTSSRRKPETNISALAAQVRAYNPGTNAELLKRAFAFAEVAHEGQERADGQPFINHPFAVAMTLAELEMDDASIAAALLHDVIEDTQTTLEQLKGAFGDEIASLVEGVTKISRLDFASASQRRAENLRKMLLAMAKDLRVILIKLSDRLHNLRTLKSLPEDKQRAVAEETIQIFAPISHRLGVWRLKWELEDLSLRYLEPETYNTIRDRIDRTREDREGIVNDAITQLRARLEDAGIQAEITGRPKHFYSIYQKMQTQSVDFKQILDLVAIRVIVQTVSDCWSVLGLVHELWVPLPEGFSDHVSKAKPNGYRALHTKVVGAHGEPMEVQIRTWDMHRVAEYGVAAHWIYKEGARPANRIERQFSWVRHLLDYQPEMKDPQEWLESLKLDLFRDQVFVFTPKGDVIDLPAGSTPVDFAYRIHTNIGHHCHRAKVNTKMVPLHYQFKNGDVVEIETKSDGAPSLDWLSFVATNLAKSRIKGWYRRLRRDEDLQRGRELLEEECKRQSLASSEYLKSEALAQVAARFNYVSEDDLVAAVGYREVSAETVINRLREPSGQPRALPTIPTTPAARTQGSLPVGISASGVGDVLFRLSRCCAPVPGDVIIGYVTRGKGVTVHRDTCPNLQSISETEPQRLIRVEWTLSSEAHYPVEVEIEALDRMGLLNDITAIFTGSKTNIRSARIRTIKGGIAQLKLVLDIRDLEHLRSLMDSVNALPDVLRIHRVGASS